MYPVKRKYPLKDLSSITTNTIYPVKNPGKKNLPLNPSPADTSYSTSRTQANSYSSHINSRRLSSLSTAVAKVARNSQRNSTGNQPPNPSEAVASKVSSYSGSGTQQKSYSPKNNAHRVSSPSGATVPALGLGKKVTLENRHNNADNTDSKRQKLEALSSPRSKLDSQLPRQGKMDTQRSPGSNHVQSPKNLHKPCQGDPANSLYIPGLTLHLPPQSTKHDYKYDLITLFESCARSKIDISMKVTATAAGNRWMAKLSIQNKHLFTGHGQGPSKSRNDAATKALDALCKFQPIRYKNIDEMVFKYPEKMGGLTLYKESRITPKDKCLKVLIDSCNKCNLPVKWWNDGGGQVFGTGRGTVLVINDKPICWGVGEDTDDAMKETAAKALEEFRHQPYIIIEKGGNGQAKEQSIKGTHSPNTTAAKRKHSSNGNNNPSTELTTRKQSGTTITTNSLSSSGAAVKQKPTEDKPPEKQQKVDGLHPPSGNSSFNVPRLTLYLPANSEKQETLENPILILIESCFKSGVSVKIDCPQPKETLPWEAKLHIEDKQSEIGLTSVGGGKDAKSAREDAAQKALRILRKCQPYMYKKKEDLFLQPKEKVKDLKLYYLKGSKDGVQLTHLGQLIDSCERCNLPVAWWDDGGGRTFGLVWTTILLINSKPICWGHGSTLDQAKNNTAFSAIGRLKATQPFFNVGGDTKTESSTKKESKSGGEETKTEITTKKELKSGGKETKTQSTTKKELKSGGKETKTEITTKKEVKSGAEETKTDITSKKELKSRGKETKTEITTKEELKSGGEETKTEIATINKLKSGGEETKTENTTKKELKSGGKETKTEITTKKELKSGGEETKTETATKNKLKSGGEETNTESTTKKELKSGGEETKMEITTEKELQSGGKEAETEITTKNDLKSGGEEKKTEITTKKESKSGGEEILKRTIPGLEIYVSDKAEPQSAEYAKLTVLRSVARCNMKLSVQDVERKSTMPKDGSFSTSLHIEDVLVACGYGETQFSSRMNAWEVALDVLMQTQVVVCESKKSATASEAVSKSNMKTGSKPPINTVEVPKCNMNAVTEPKSNINTSENTKSIKDSIKEIEASCENNTGGTNSQKSTVICSQSSSQLSTMNTTTVQLKSNIDTPPNTKSIEDAINEKASCKKNTGANLQESAIVCTHSSRTEALKNNTSGKKKSFNIHSQWIDRTATAAELKINEESNELIEKYLQKLSCF